MYKQGEILAITYDVWLSGTQLSAEKKAYVRSIHVKETVEGADSATLIVNDPEYLFLEDNIFKEEAPIKLQLGWDSTTYRVNFDGYISAIDTDFASSGIPTLTITCMDNTHKMNRERKSATFNDCTSADVVKKIVAEYGFQCVIDKDYSFTKQETITQSNQTDIDFLTTLANNEVYPFTARLVGNTFYYVKIGKYTTPKMTLTYREFPHDIISFSPKLNKEYRQEAIQASVINTSDKTPASTTETPEGGTTTVGNASRSSNPTSERASRTLYYDPRTGRWYDRQSSVNNYNPSSYYERQAQQRRLRDNPYNPTNYYSNGGR